MNLWNTVDFPVRSDFETSDDWIHEAKKYPYEYWIAFDNLYDISLILEDLSGREPLHAIDIDSNGTFMTQTNGDGSIIIHTEYSRHIDRTGLKRCRVIFARDENALNLIRYIISENSITHDYKITKPGDYSQLEESVEYYTDDFPLRSDFSEF